MLDQNSYPSLSLFLLISLRAVSTERSARKGKLKNVGGRWAEQKGESVADFVRREREQGFEDMDETFLRNVSRLGNKFRGTELGGAHTGLAGEDEEEEVRGLSCVSCWLLYR